MNAPALHVLAGPNGAGKSTFAIEVLVPTTRLTFVNADEIAAARWPGDEVAHAYEASRAAARQRDALITERRSFIAETVFSHPSKVDLVGRAVAAGYLATLHVMVVPEELAVARVLYRVGQGGHAVPEPKVRERYHRLWPLVVAALPLAHKAVFYDNSRSDTRAFSTIATFQRGRPASATAWPAWAPAVLQELA